MSEKRRSPPVRIINPRDAATHTSARRAADMVRRGIAVYVRSEADRTSIKLIDDAELRRSQQIERARQVERSIVNDRHGVIWWDGCEPGSQTAPRLGVVGNKAYGAPDSMKNSDAFKLVTDRCYLRRTEELPDVVRQRINRDRAEIEREEQDRLKRDNANKSNKFNGFRKEIA